MIILAICISTIVPFQTHAEIRHTILVSFNPIKQIMSSKRISLGSVFNPFFFVADIAWWVMVVASGGM